MFSRPRTFIAAAAVAIALAVAVGGVAYSAVPAPVTGGPAGAGLCAIQAATARAGATVADLRAFGNCEIGRRLTTLHQLASAVAASKGLTSADSGALSSRISSDVDGLTKLRAAINSQPRIAALRLELVQVVTGYRVYVELLPQVRLVVAADSELALKPHFDQLSTTLAGRIAAAQANGKDVTAAQASLDAMNAAVADAVALAAPQPAKLLALTAANYNAASTTTLLRNVRVALGTARNDLKNAAQDGRDVLAALK
jgi:hypothetical protein